MKTALFIDRDGTLIVEPPVTFQVDTLDQMTFLPGVLRNLYFIRKNLSFDLIMVTNQDGLGTDVYPQKNFDTVQAKMLETLSGEGISFDAIHIDKSFPEDNLPTRKPGTGMLKQYMDGSYDLKNCFVIGDRVTDVKLAQNLGCKAIFIAPSVEEGTSMVEQEGLSDACAKVVTCWDQISEFLFAGIPT